MPSRPRSIAPDALLSMLASSQSLLVLDVRSAPEFRRGHLPRARRLPFWTAFWAPTPPAAIDAAVVLYCGHGPRAWIAAWALRRRGVRDVRLLRGHMAAWRRSRLPVETEP